MKLLKEAIPKTERVAVFVNQTNPGAAPFLADLISVARARHQSPAGRGEHDR